MNHMTITKIYTLDTGELEVDNAAEQISSLPADSAAKRLLRIGLHQIMGLVLMTGNICNNAHLGEFNKLVGQATDIACIEILEKFNLEDVRQVNPLPPKPSSHPPPPPIRTSCLW
jgi:magnesium-transporting ATPase (P-type)